MLTVDPSKSRVLIETEAAGLLASLAHDLRIVAPVAEGASPDGVSCSVRFEVARMRVEESSRHGAHAWHAPSPADASDIEGRIRRELFEGCATIEVSGKLDLGRATLAVQARDRQIVGIPIVVERGAGSARATGRCELSLRALGAGKVRVPLGAIKLEDRVSVAFDVAFRES